MKKNIVLLLLAITCQVFAQTNLITGINISLPANPDANIDEWSKAMPPLMISAQTRMEYGKVSPMVMESRILVSIKGGGAVCGSYTKANAPASNFNSPAKVWSGVTALNLLGKTCVLAPGDYELCVQFFGEGAVGQVVIGEACKSFTIKETEHKSYQPPQALAPANGLTYTTGDFAKPQMYRWTPVIPRPQEPVTYRLKVWQLMQGQTSIQAVKVNQPIITKDVDNMTQTLVNSIIDGPCKPPYRCDFVWNVQALNREGKPIGENNGMSEAFTFRIGEVIINPINNSPSIKLVTPSNGEKIAEANPTFVWNSIVKNPPKGTVMLPYKIKIIEIIGDQSPEEAILRSKSFFEKNDIRQQTFQYPSSAPKLEEGKKYAWQVNSGNIKSDVSIFDRWGNLYNKIECDDYKVEFRKITQQETISYNLSITNEYRGELSGNKPVSFRIEVKGGSVESISMDLPSGWKRTPSKFPPGSSQIKWTNNSGDIPQGETKFGNLIFKDNYNPIKVNYAWLDIKGKIICKDSLEIGSESVACKNNLIQNGGFDQANVSGTMPLPGSIQNWVRGYGSPIVDNNPGEGFNEQGFIKLLGNISSGQAVAQELNSNNKIITGKRYKLSVAVRFLSSDNKLDYAKIRAVAYNGNIFSATGNHPLPSSDVAIIGRSSKIKDCNDWSVIEFPVWTANKDFSSIAINAFTNDGSNAMVWIDNITICESAQEDCDELQLASNGNPITPAGYGALSPGFTCQPEAEENDYYNGSLQDLYPGYNGTTSLYSQNINHCASIGGTLPPEVNNYNCDDSLRAEGIDMTCEEMQTMLNQEFIPTEIKKSYLPPILTIGNNKCDKPGPKNIENMPFQGRDIIYIHGLQLSHIIDRANGYPGTTGKWPNNQSEYYSGYYKNAAVHNMLPHIDHFLKSRGNLNRYIIVSYDCSESAEVALHSVLSQIREAMENGTGVVSDPSDPRRTNCFGRDYVMVSHSTGALVADVALSIANKTKTDLNLKAQYGDIGLISNRCKGRVSIQGAFSGSNLAKIAVVGAQADPVLFSAALTALSFAPLSSQTISTILANTDIIPNSILVDLVPSIARSRWGSYINDISVPVFTIAGGHPSAILGPLKYSILKGFDDGVLSMDGANGNNNPLSLGPSSFNANPVKVFDMGIPLIRGINYYLDQKISQGVFAAASTAYLSPTGMVLPVSSINVDPQNHFKNHYSFIQSSKEHWFNATEPGSGNNPCDYNKTLFGGSTNNEEQLVVTNPGLFAPGLIDPAIISQMGETVKDKHINYPWLKIVYRHGIPRPTVYWKKFYIWKRTYHKLIDNCMYDVDYAYKYLFKQ